MFSQWSSICHLLLLHFRSFFHTETTESSPHIRSRAPTSPSNPWDLHRQTLLLERIWDELLHSHPQKDRKVNPGFKFPWRLVTFLSSWGYFRSFLKCKSCEYCHVHENLNQGKESSTWLHNNIIIHQHQTNWFCDGDTEWEIMLCGEVVIIQPKSSQINVEGDREQWENGREVRFYAFWGLYK